MGYNIFFTVLNMSLTGGLVILAVLFLRLLLRRAPKFITYCLWAVVLFRLLCPVSFTLPHSFLETVGSPTAEQGRVYYIPEDIIEGKGAKINLPVSGQLNQVLQDVLPIETEGAWGAN